MSPPARPTRRRVLGAALLGSFALVAAGEAALAVRFARSAPARGDWAQAGAFVSAAWQPGDTATAAPPWTDPLLRAALGPRLTPRLAGRSDLSGVRRLWVLSVRGADAEEARGATLEASRAFGEVTVRRYVVSAPPVRVDFRERLPEAEVVVVSGDGAERPCARGGGVKGRAGLGAGPLPPETPWTCGRGKGAAWVGETVVEDLRYAPRSCIRQPVTGGGVTRVRFREVPLGDRWTLHMGLYHRDERPEKGAPITLTVHTGGAGLAEFVHRDGEGWTRHEVVVPAALRGVTADVAFDVASPGTKGRNLCWSAVVH